MKTLSEVLKVLEETETELKKLNNGILDVRRCLKNAITNEAEISFLGITINAAKEELGIASQYADELIHSAEKVYDNLPILRDTIEELI